MLGCRMAAAKAGPLPHTHACPSLYIPSHYHTITQTLLNHGLQLLPYFLSWWKLWNRLSVRWGSLATVCYSGHTGLGSSWEGALAGEAGSLLGPHSSVTSAVLAGGQCPPDKLSLGSGRKAEREQLFHGCQEWAPEAIPEGSGLKDSPHWG